MLLPLPFASVSPREMIMHGLPQRSVTRDATMPITPWCPVFTVHHDHAVFHVSFRFDIRKRRFGNLCFHTAAFLVIGADFLTQYLGFLFIAADEQAHGAFRRAHTARRVDARAQV